MVKTVPSACLEACSSALEALLSAPTSAHGLAWQGVFAAAADKLDCVGGVLDFALALATGMVSCGLLDMDSESSWGADLMWQASLA